jgi:hypothetical protein
MEWNIIKGRKEMRANYWSNSKFSKYLRSKIGIVSPTALTWQEWKLWREDYKSKNPKMYWVTEDLLDSVQDFINYIPDKLYSAKYYLKNRFVTKTHYIKTGLKPGHWHELDDRILFGLFNELVDFVEVDKAWMFVVFDNEMFDKYKFPKTFKNRFLRWKHFRCPEAGIAHLNWESSLEDSESQSNVAKEILFLYDWWKNIRPERPDPYDVSGYDKLEHGFDVEPTKELYEALEKSNELEKKYDNEDTEMLYSLIKIRNSLWT